VKTTATTFGSGLQTRLWLVHPGAGKSSLINCIFRLMELDSGRITIDGIDIARLGVKQLRSRMAIIPQARCSWL
jgi:ABC-type multidrug transport system fused ATPase/permease subunit